MVSSAAGPEAAGGDAEINADTRIIDKPPRLGFLCCPCFFSFAPDPAELFSDTSNFIRS